jgi:hypothetical protein
MKTKLHARLNASEFNVGQDSGVVASAGCAGHYSRLFGTSRVRELRLIEGSAIRAAGHNEGATTIWHALADGKLRSGTRSPTTFLVKYCLLDRDVVGLQVTVIQHEDGVRRAAVGNGSGDIGGGGSNSCDSTINGLNAFDTVFRAVLNSQSYVVCCNSQLVHKVNEICGALGALATAVCNRLVNVSSSIGEVGYLEHQFKSLHIHDVEIPYWQCPGYIVWVLNLINKRVEHQANYYENTRRAISNGSKHAGCRCGELRRRLLDISLALSRNLA